MGMGSCGSFGYHVTNFFGVPCFLCFHTQRRVLLGQSLMSTLACALLFLHWKKGSALATHLSPPSPPPPPRARARTRSSTRSSRTSTSGASSSTAREPSSWAARSRSPRAGGPRTLACRCPPLPPRWLLRYVAAVVLTSKKRSPKTMGALLRAVEKEAASAGTGGFKDPVRGRAGGWAPCRRRRPGRCWCWRWWPNCPGRCCRWCRRWR